MKIQTWWVPRFFVDTLVTLGMSRSPMAPSRGPGHPSCALPGLQENAAEESALGPDLSPRGTPGKYSAAHTATATGSTVAL